MRLRKNRKGEDMMFDFWAILVFALILILFLIIFIVDKRSDNSGTETQQWNDDPAYMLNSFLRAPYSKDQKKTIGEVIVEEETYKRSQGKKYEGAGVLEFDRYFKGVDIYRNYVICEFQLYVGDADPHKFDPTSEMEDINNCISTESTTKLPQIDGSELSIKIVVYYNPKEKL